MIYIQRLTLKGLSLFLFLQIGADQNAQMSVVPVSCAHLADRNRA